MRKLIVICSVLLVMACGKEVIEKPDNLIGKEKMTDIIYDLAILEAMRSQKPIILEQNGVNQNTYIYKKHGIDSVQFATSNRYYASDLVTYEEIYDAVAKRLESHKTPAAPTDPEAGVIK